MEKYVGEVKVSDAERAVKTLCRHFERKVKVDYNTIQGKAKNKVFFPLGFCDIYETDFGIRMEIYGWQEKAENGKTGLDVIKYILEDHIARFNYKDEVIFNWGIN